MKKLIYLLLVMIIVCVSGCNLSKNTEQRNATENYQVTDDLGTVLHFEKAPQRIITSNLSYQDILCELITVDRFAAVSANSLDEDYSFTADKVKNVPNKYYQPINAEAILKYKPDVYITSDETPVVVNNTLEDMGVKVFVIKASHSYQDIQHSIVKLAELVNEQEKGQAMLRKMDARRNALKEKIQTTRKSSDKIVVELTYNGTYGMRQDIFGVLCELSMCKNGMQIMPAPSSTVVSKERLVDLNPDVLLLPKWSFLGKHNSDTYLQQIIADPAYKDMQCIKNRTVYKFPEKYRYCASQYVVESAENLARIVYPECYK